MNGYLITILCLFLISLTACSEEQQQLGVTAERQYVDLLYALQRGDRAASRTADSAFHRTVSQLRRVWYRPLPADDLDEVRYHIDLAECAYDDARASIEAGQLDWATVQLDRAVYELQAGDGASLGELYVGSIYDFVGSWLEVDYTLRGQGYEVDRRAFRDCVRHALRNWRMVRGQWPARAYFDGRVDPVAFASAHALLDERVESFYLTVRTDAYGATLRDRGNEVSEALWDLLLLFSSGTTAVPAGDTAAQDHQPF